MTVPPASSKRLLKALAARIRAEATDQGVSERYIQRAVANTIFAQMLPSGVVKGGSGIKLRVGERQSRFTPDFDTAFKGDLVEFQKDLEKALAGGWYGFGGTVTWEDKAKPDGVADEYVMQPFRVKMTFGGLPWLSIDLEVGHDEIGSTEDGELVIADDLIGLFARLDLPQPGPVNVMRIDHQIAQKLHAVSLPGSERAHDLVDLQLLAVDGVDMVRVAATVRRLFVYRKTHDWPPTIVVGPSWESIYAEAAVDLDVASHVDEAVVWVNALVSSVDGQP